MSRNTAQISGQHEFGKLAGVTEKTDAALLIKDLIFKLTSGRQMQTCLKRLTIFSLYLKLYPCVRIEILSVVTSCIFLFNIHLTFLSPSHHIWGMGTLMKLKLEYLGWKDSRSSSPQLSSCGIYSQLESIHSCSYWANNTTKALANFQQKNTGLLPNVPLYNWLYLMGLCRLKCHTFPHTPFTQNPMFPC